MLIPMFSDFSFVGVVFTHHHSSSLRESLLSFILSINHFYSQDYDIQTLVSFQSLKFQIFQPLTQVMGKRLGLSKNLFNRVQPSFTSPTSTEYIFLSV